MSNGFGEPGFYPRPVQQAKDRTVGVRVADSKYLKTHPDFARLEKTGAYEYAGEGRNHREDATNSSRFLYSIYNELLEKQKNDAYIFKDPNIEGWANFAGVDAYNLKRILADIEKHPETHGYVRIVADGMGGHQDGELAAVYGTWTTLFNYHQNRCSHPELNQNQAMMDALQRANDLLYQRNVRLRRNGGASMAVDLKGVAGHDIYTLGDVSALKFRRQNGHFILVNESIAHSGILRADGSVALYSDRVLAKREGRDGSNIIESALGNKPSTKARIGHVFFGSLTAGEVITMQTDGVEFTAEEIGRMLDQSNDPQRLAEDLARKSESTDNRAARVIFGNNVPKSTELASYSRVEGQKSPMETALDRLMKSDTEFRYSYDPLNITHMDAYARFKNEEGYLPYGVANDGQLLTLSTQLLQRAWDLNPSRKKGDYIVVPVPHPLHPETTCYVPVEVEYFSKHYEQLGLTKPKLQSVSSLLDFLKR